MICINNYLEHETKYHSLTVASFAVNVPCLRKLMHSSFDVSVIIMGP